MKTNLLKAICLMALTITSLPILANDYLKIYFKDGHTERHYMKLVESISATKYDLEGNLHSDYQMQQIVMKDTTYSYYIEDIDSMSFTKVYEEQVSSRVESVQSSLEPLFQQCSNLEDLASHINEIKSIDGVEEVHYDGNNLFIQIRDWFGICINDLPKPEDFVSSTESSIRKNIKRFLPTTEDGSQMKVTIGFQMENDEYWAKEKKITNELHQDFSTMKYNTSYYLGEEMDLDFFDRHIFDNNLLLIVTHCFYNSMNNQHYFYTGIESSSGALVGYGIDRLFNISKDIDLDDIFISGCHYKSGNIFNNTFNYKWFISVKEDFIQKSSYRFSGPGPHIVFIAACSSLYGSDSFAKVFFEKGADVYLGYNTETSLGPKAAACFFDYMMHGASVEKAYDKLSTVYKCESENDVILVDLYNKDSKYYNSKNIFIVNTHTTEKANQDFQADYYNDGTVELKGETLISSSYHGSEEEDFGSVYGFINYGFFIATQPNVDIFAHDESVISSNSHFTNRETGEVDFSGMFTPTPGKTYYYRAFTFDGIKYNWGEEKTFYIIPLCVSKDYLTLEVGWTQTVDIIVGSGSYEVESDNEEVATVFVYENTISINALSSGPATITVKDTKTGQTTTIQVEVTQKADSEVETFTVNGVSFDMVKVKGGTFTMGATQEQDGAADANEKPAHQVVLPTYYMGKYEVTQELWQAVTGKNPATQKGEKRPVGRVTWDDCQQFVSKLNELTGQKFRLPTEAEWEYAARGGSKSNGNKYAGGDEIAPVAWYNTNSSNATHDVGQKSPNELGLYDMSGNVWEWCEDWYGSYGSETQANPVGPSSGSERVARGGSYMVGEKDCRVSSRGHFAPGAKNGSYGMRLALSVEGALVDLILSSTSPLSLRVGGRKNISIIAGNGNYTVQSSDDGVATASVEGETVIIKAISEGPATITITDTKTGQSATIEVTVKAKSDTADSPSCPDNNHPHWIDLGLPSGTQWRCCNEGASTPEAYGDHYIFGQVSTAPTVNQFDELIRKTTSVWTQLNGVNGRMFTGPNGDAIFLPAAGGDWRDDLYGEGGWYWSSTPYYDDFAYDLYFDSSYLDWGNGSRNVGRSVRSVSK